MMESAGQLLLSAPPLQLPSLMANVSSTATATTNAATICCFLPKIEAAMEQQERMETENASGSPIENGEDIKIGQEILGEEEAQTAADEENIRTAAASMANKNDAQNGQQESGATLAPSSSLPAVIKPPGDEKEERPSLSYKDLIIEAIESSPERRLKLSEIYQVIKYLHPYYQRRADQWGWQNSIRHNLSLHDCFVKLPLKQTSANGVVGHFWTVVHRNPEEKQGPTRRRSRANVGSGGGGGGKGGGGGGGGKKGAAHSLGQTQNGAAGGGKAKGLKGRQSVSSDSGVMSDDGGMGGCHSGTISPLAGGGSASVPLPALLQIPQQNEQQMNNKFQPLQSPLALSSHTPTTLQHFPFQPQSTQSIQQQNQLLMSPLELVLNGQNAAASLVQSPHHPQIVQFSPIPGKTAPVHPQTSLLEQQLQQLLAASANANFGHLPQNGAAQMMGGPSSSPPQAQQPTTPASAPPTFLTGQSAAAHNPMALMASLGGGGPPASSTNDAGLGLLSQLATQLLAASSSLTSAGSSSSPAVPLSSPQFGPVQSQQQQQNNSLAIATAAAAAELQRLQMLQIYAEQQKQQLEQQLALLEQNRRDQLMLRLGHSAVAHIAHSAPLSPTSEQQQPQPSADQSSAILTQLLLSKLFNAPSSMVADQLPIQPAHQPQLPPKTSPPPPPLATTMPPSSFGPQMEFLLDQQQFGQRPEGNNSREAADLMLLGPILLQQLQQRQREEDAATNAQQQQQMAAAAAIVQAVQQQQQIQQALVDNSESELAVV